MWQNNHNHRFSTHLKSSQEEPTLRKPQRNQTLAGADNGDLTALLREAWQISRSRHGNRLTAYVPGMFVVDGKRGKYRAVSITGDRCDLDCDHCKGTLLRTMAHAPDPERLLRFGLDAWARGDKGMLVTGGCDAAGHLPWTEFLPVIGRLKAQTGLTITVHAGQVDASTARSLKDAGVDQALVDVIGDDGTARETYHLADGVTATRRTLAALAEVGLEIVPHIIYGIHHGEERGERAALEMLKDLPLNKYAIVVLMPTKGTPMAEVTPPAPEAVARFIAQARLDLPHCEASLGCARPRGQHRRQLDVLAVRAGVNSIAIPADEALREAERLGLETVFMETCCSLR